MEEFEKLDEVKEDAEGDCINYSLIQFRLKS